MSLGEPDVDRHHRHLHGEGGEEGDPEEDLAGLAKGDLEEGQEVRGSGLKEDEKDSKEKEDGSEEGVEEELVSGPDLPLPSAPNADDKKHGDENTFEENVEEEEVEAREDEEKEGLEDEEGDDEADLVPGRPDPTDEEAGREKEGRKNDEEEGDPVDSDRELEVDEGGLEQVAPRIIDNNSEGFELLKEARAMVEPDPKEGPEREGEKGPGEAQELPGPNVVDKEEKSADEERCEDQD